MAQGNKVQRTPEKEAESVPDGTYEEIHAAIHELYRLMGVAHTNPSVQRSPTGYTVYTYPSPAQSSSWGQPPVNQLMTQPPLVPTYSQQAPYVVSCATPVPVWGTWSY